MIAAGVVLIVTALALRYTPLGFLSWIAFPVGMILVLASGMSRYAAHRTKIRAQVLIDGVPGVARIVGARRTEPALRGSHAVNLQLEVRLPDRRPYLVSTTPTVLASTRLHEGDVLLVRVVPTRRFDVHFDPAPHLPESLALPTLPLSVDALPTAARLDHVRDHGAPATMAVKAATPLGENLYRLTVEITPTTGEPTPATDLALTSPIDLHGGTDLPVRLMRRAAGTPSIAVLWP